MKAEANIHRQWTGCPIPCPHHVKNMKAKVVGPSLALMYLVRVMRSSGLVGDAVLAVRISAY